MTQTIATLAGALGGTLALCCLAAPVSAAIVALDGSVSTTVQELIDGVPGSVDGDTALLDGDSERFPLGVSGGLTSTDLNGVLVSEALGFSELDDPTRLDQPNPEEFALEVACFSNIESVAYSVVGVATESRKVAFNDEEIEFSSDGTQTVESRVFLSGALVLWAPESITLADDLDQIRGEVSVEVTRDTLTEPLFKTTLSITGESVGDVQPASSGPIRFERLEVEDLMAHDVGTETAALLQRLEDEGTLVLFVIPPQEHAYTYSVAADEEFELHARFEARVQNIPGGTGIAATLGRPFADLANFIEHAMIGIDGMAVQRSLNDATSDRSLGLVSSSSAGAEEHLLAGRLCGAIGIELAAMLSFAWLLRGGGSFLQRRIIS